MMADRQKDATDDRSEPSGPQRPTISSRMPADSPFYERVVPVLLIILAVVTLALILFAAGVLLGIVPFS